MEWTASGIILAVRPHGETSAILDILTRDHGRHAGLVRGGRSRTMRPVLQAGNGVRAVWRARLSEHLGNFTVEAEELRTGALMEDALSLAGLNAACALSVAVLPEREPHSQAFDALSLLIDHLAEPDVWPALMVRYEAGLLTDLGYGLDLDTCAVTGATTGLSHVSPRSGRAVSAAEAEPFLDKLLALPPFLRESAAELAPGDVGAGLALTGHFLQRRVLWPHDRDLPEARGRMIERLAAAGRL